MDKFGIAAALQEIASLLELKGGENRFKARAYRAGARAITGFSGDLPKLIDRNELTTIRGIGSALASQIRQLHFDNSSSVLQALRKEFPPGVLELSTVPGLTLARIRKLVEALGVSSVEELKKAAEAGRVRAVKGFGAKTEQQLLNAIANLDKREQRRPRVHIHHAERIAGQIIDYLQTSSTFQEASLAGSLRRWKETVGTIRIVASARKPTLLLKHFLRFPLIVRKEMLDENTWVVELLEGVKVSLTAVLPEQYPVALLLMTGARAHVDRLQQLAEMKSLRLDHKHFRLHSAADVTVSRRPSKKRDVREESEVYRLLGLQYVPPETREDAGEIEAALEGNLPHDLVSLADVKGMVHCHTTYSDGVNTIEQMARAAQALGMKYLTITDHSPTAFYAGGVTPDRLKRQWDEIDEVQAKVSIKLLRGTESDILADGALDYPAAILERLDVIVASVHSRYKMDAEKMTKRVVAAMRQPVFKIWGHALGRLIQRRPPFECDMERVLDVIAESPAAIEINGDPYRLDMEPRWLREARKRKIKFVISVDAHSTGALNNVRFGVGIARRAWVQRREVLNTLPLKGFMAAVRPVQ
ncbi:MAG TPA: PHP domain-containing protein [Pyrinomonadaceae bacterium]|nr:PHP domain-containing protein [Pyrinomonadaceae bacterium]